MKTFLSKAVLKAQEALGHKAVKSPNRKDAESNKVKEDWAMSPNDALKAGIVSGYK